MKIARIIFSTLAVATIAAVCYQWNEQGCGAESLAAAVVYYAAIYAALYGVVASYIKERAKQ